VEGLKYQLIKAIAVLTCCIALAGAGLASAYGWYQPKVPEKLCR